MEPGWRLFKAKSIKSEVNAWYDWLAQTIKRGKIGINYKQNTASDIDVWRTFFEKKGLNLEHHELVDILWGAERPPRPSNPVLPCDLKYSGENTMSKYNRLADELNGDPLLITTLEDIAWLLSCRGSDMKYIPAFYSYALFYPTTKTVSLYINPVQVTKISYFASTNVTVVPISEIDSDLASMAKNTK